MRTRTQLLRAAACLAAALALPDALQAQVWHERAVTTKPPPLEEHASAVDPLGRGVVLFGGHNTSGPQNQTWLYDHEKWQNLQLNELTTSRSRSAMATDTINGVSVLFSGDNGLADTWIFLGDEWLDVSALSPTSPPQRSNHAMAFDPLQGRVVLFGGGTFLNDTWTFNTANNSWTPVTFPDGAPLPTARDNHTLAFDPILGQIVLFGGRDATGTLNDVWTLDLITPAWTQQATSFAPGPRENHAMAFQPQRNKLVVHGGTPGTGYLNDTFELDTSTWTWSLAVPPATPTMVGHSLALGVRNELVLYGGTQGGTNSLGSTWAMPVPSPSPNEAVPAREDWQPGGCTIFTPPQLSSDTRPRLNSNYRLTVTGDGEVAWLSMGFAPAQGSCNAFSHNSVAATYKGMPYSGVETVHFDFTVPNDVSLMGLPIFAQSAVYHIPAGAYLLSNQVIAVMGN